MLLFLWLLPGLFEPGLMVEFHNIRDGKGSLYVAVYDRETAFLNVKQVYAQKILPIRQAGVQRISLDGLPPGRYAISCFHDLNGNGQLDTNWMGIPSEPYGFSNNARPKFRAPKWAEAVFDLKGSGKTVSIKLEEW